MDSSDLISHPADVLALAERVCPSLNGPSSFRLAAALEALDAGLVLNDFEGLADVAVEIQKIDRQRVEHWGRVLEESDVRLVSVLDDEYPTNLRMVHDHPPFLFVRGSMERADERAVAVVGTRKPSEEGLAAARDIAAKMAHLSITVVSGMAIGIDTAAHRGSLTAGGRTVAVLGSGLDRVYPASNRGLARSIERSGAVVSQFWPDMGPTRWSFPVRNIVTSGLSLGTVVVEAGPTSGARQQADHALRHGKRLYLLRRLVSAQAWAREMADLPGVLAIDDIDQIVADIEAEVMESDDVLI